ncbi:formyltetrahydrofolate deformylase [Cerasicoccus arenae]|uniref:Formyltetrahydrofolate deformylase n=1 Tax=Cerasicoccus arenae TaxID=424488 RepID=A0A8J3GCS2_9BACT|nr:formyltetrahydrofolate deformylase [Cerasicoccus arenae]MBK1857923.1 formyltetrahydrofolate deformylase [Cerasicoccus arenae]GHC00728.1 formyltetrahydrofolate deformylase [Cerasicoccus arenae]
MLDHSLDRHLTALLFGPDKPGIVASVSNWIFNRGGNIRHADQHRDDAAGVFFQRLVWKPAETNEAESEGQDFAVFAREELGMSCNVSMDNEEQRVGIMVSKIDHCFHDIALRFRSGEFRGKAVVVVSNHPDLAEAAASYGLPFHCVPVTKANKAEAEREQIRLLQEAGVSLVVMARYMQVLSEDFLSNIGCPVINIHHSFLPAFAGGRPYHQAYDRGVKLIGATAHFATADLDEGPIIAQDVARVTHRHGPENLVRRGRDLEKAVFAQAIRWQLEHRILVYHNKTVVFD